jgi:hypothetical protein
MESEVSGAWNEAVLEILAKRLLAKNSGLRLSEKPPEYIKKLLQAKFRRCRRYWNNGKPRKLADGALETVEDIEMREEGRKEDELKRQRHTTRRINVNYCPVSECDWLTDLLEISEASPTRFI